MDFSLTLFELVLMCAHAGTESAYSIVEEGDPDLRAGKKGEMLRGDLVLMRVFRSAGQVNKFDSNRPFLAVIETA